MICKRKWRRGCHIPPHISGPIAFRVACFTDLIRLRIEAEQDLETYRLLKDMVLSPQGMSEKTREIVLYQFWRWQRRMNPAAIRPYTDVVEDLHKQMEDLKSFFESGQGLSITPER